MRQQVLYRRVHMLQNNLRNDSKQEHESDYRSHAESLSSMQIRKARPPLRNRPVEHLLNNSQNHRSGNDQTKHRNARRNPRQREHSTENQELADKSVQARQAKRREHGDS